MEQTMVLALNAFWKEAVDDLLVAALMVAAPLGWRKLSHQNIDWEYVTMLFKFVGAAIAIAFLVNVVHILTGF
jgi:hypothetical protein